MDLYLSNSSEFTVISPLSGHWLVSLALPLHPCARDDHLTPHSLLILFRNSILLLNLNACALLPLLWTRNFLALD